MQGVVASRNQSHSEVLMNDSTLCMTRIELATHEHRPKDIHPIVPAMFSALVAQLLPPHKYREMPEAAKAIQKEANKFMTKGAWN